MDTFLLLTLDLKMVPKDSIKAGWIQLGFRKKYAKKLQLILVDDSAF
jgi:hypothetical protein